MHFLSWSDIVVKKCKNYFDPLGGTEQPAELKDYKVQCLKEFCCHGNKSTILLFNSPFRKTPEVSTKLYQLK